MSTQCEPCQRLDIRALLLNSAAQAPERSRKRDDYTDAADYRPAVPHFYAHQESIVALKRSAEQGCESCNFLWSTWIKTVSKADVTEEWLLRTFPGQLHLGSSAWTASRQGLPYLTLTQKTSQSQGRTLCSFEPFARREDVPLDGAAYLGRAVAADSSSDACISTAREWLTTCLEDHKQCAINALEVTLPTRAIDVGNEDASPRLVNTNAKRGKYIALSYCWGGESTFIFNDRTSHDLYSGIELERFPATLRDAVVITRRLGFQYLWIDALCIKQDSAADWAAEAAKMKDVYSRAEVTVVAASSPSTHSGIFSKRALGSRAVFEWKGSASKIYLRPGSELWDHSLQSSPLMKRGWTLQEGLLAPRTLSYGQQQMIWECSTHQADESGRITIATQDYRAKAFMQQLTRAQNTMTRLTLHFNPWWKSFGIANPYDKWYDIVEQFCSRSLTKDTDTLPALSGIARAFQTVLNDVYLAGLWKKDLLCSLQWNHSPRYPTDQSTRFDLTKPTTYLAPSWSWASMLGREPSMIGNHLIRAGLEKPSLFSGGNSHGAMIKKVSTTLAGADEFGQVSDGQLVLTAPFHILELVPPVYSLEEQFHEVPDDLPTVSVFEKLMYTNMTVINSVVYEYYQKHQPHPGQKFAVIELTRWSSAPGSKVPGMDFLILESTGRDSEWRRIGGTGLRKYPEPNPVEVTGSMYTGILTENQAYDEVVAGNWERRKVILV